MSSKNTVTSKTSRDNEGFSDFCWMEIREEKLQNAAKNNDLYHFCCYIGGETFAYSYPAVELQAIFKKKRVRLRAGKNSRYSFYIEYPTGRIFNKLTLRDEEDNLVCTLIPEKEEEKEPQEQGHAKRIIPVEYKAENKLETALKEMQCDHLPKLVASTALWATKKEYEECLAKGSPAKHPHIRRKYSHETRGEGENGARLDDNSYPNAQMKASLKKRGIIPVGYETCHIWEDTCYKSRYHTCYANLVLLPRAIASLSDHNDTVKAILRWQAYERFNGFIPDGYVMPEKPAIYEQIKHLFSD